MQHIRFVGHRGLPVITDSDGIYEDSEIQISPPQFKIFYFYFKAKGANKKVSLKTHLK
jgi:hypothetical protein